MNPNKTISVNSKGFIVSFTDSNKHHFVKFKTQDHRKDLKVQSFEKPLFNKRQQEIYSEALYGLTTYTEQEIDRLPKSKVEAIFNNCYRVQKLINRWKQEIVNEKVDNLLVSLFPKSAVTKAFVETRGIEDSIKVTIPFKDLDLNKTKIVNKLIEFNLLPKNFYELV